jgi:hypothetical protein
MIMPNAAPNAARSPGIAKILDLLVVTQAWTLRGDGSSERKRSCPVLAELAPFGSLGNELIIADKALL